MSSQDDEHLDMQLASLESIHVRDSNQGSRSTDQIFKELDAPVQTCQNRVSIEDRINDMTMQNAIELPIVHDSQGDTLIYIDAPQKQPEQDDYEYKRYIKRYENPIRMQKDTLTRYSPGLANLFGPTQQYKVIRRRKLANKLPNNVKYVLDLTPPSEGEDAVYLTTELCCSEGVRLWYQSSEIWKVARTLVKGVEEYTSVSSKTTSNRLTDRQELGELNPIPADSKGRRSQATPSSVMALEYSPVRHRSSIERVLAALQGNDPKLDSAIKVWTAFAVAKNFEIIHSPLEDYIIRWLRAYPNSNFLEVLPEVSHQIADGLQNYDLARDSFAILVGEEALDNLRQARQPWVHKCSTFGRKKEELPEYIHTRVEYASKSFLERMKMDFADLVDNGMQWIDDLPEVQKLSAYPQREMQETIHELKFLLKEYVRGVIYKTLCVDYDSVPGPDLHQEGGRELLPRLDRAAVWANMPLDERILSRTFWEALRSVATLPEPSNFVIANDWSVKGDQLSHIEMQELDRGTYREVFYTSLIVCIGVGQRQLHQASVLEHTSISAQSESKAGSSSDRLHTLPDRTTNGAKDQKQPLDLLFESTPDDNIYNGELTSRFEPLPKHSYALPDRTINRAKGVDGSNEVSFSTATRPIDVPKPLKRTQGFLDTLSPPDGEDSETRLRTKWPFGAARDDPVAQVRKSVDNLYISSASTDRRSVADSSLDESDERGNEGIPAKIDPWRGFSDHLSRADNALQNLVPHKERFIPITCAPKERVSHFEEHVAWADDDLYDPWNKDKKMQQKWEMVRPRNYNKFFDDKRFFHQAQNYIDTFAGNKLRSSDRGCPKEPLELGIVNTLVCLEESEWKYLPLWAGGNDDGSMGVYNDDLPTAEHGFTTAGPGIHDGSTPSSSIKTPSEFELVSDESASTFNASTATNRGFSDAIRRGHVHAADSVDGSMSDSFTIVTASVDSDDEETFARKQVEAQERIERANEAAANEARRVAKGFGKTVVQDESYADFFSGEEAEEEDDDDDDDDSDDTDHAETVDDEDMVMV